MVPHLLLLHSKELRFSSAFSKSGFRTSMWTAGERYDEKAGVGVTTTFWSLLAETMALPSGVQTMAVTSSLCGWKVKSALPLVTSQTLTCRSIDPEARYFPSGEKVTDVNSSSRVYEERCQWWR